MQQLAHDSNMKAEEHAQQTAIHSAHDDAAASSSAAAAAPLPPLHPSAHSPSLTAMQQLLSIATEASKQQKTEEHEANTQTAAAAGAAEDAAESVEFESKKRARSAQRSHKRASKEILAEDAPVIEGDLLALPAASSSAAADTDRTAASEDRRLSRMRRSYRQQVLAHQQELLKVDNITGALREVSKLAKEAQREVAAPPKARGKRGAAAAATASAKDDVASNSNLQQDTAQSSSSNAAVAIVPSNAPTLASEPAAAAAADSSAASPPQPFWTRSQQRAVLQKIENLSNKALAEADAQLHAVSGRQLRARKPKVEKKEDAASEADDEVEAAEGEEEDEEEEEEPAADDDDEDEIPEDEDPSDFEEELFGRKAAVAPSARKQAGAPKARASSRSVSAKKAPPKSAKPSRTLVNSHIDQRPVYIHYVYTRQQYTLSIDEARALTSARRAEKVVLPVRWLCTSKRNRKNGPGAAPTMADLFVVAKDIATLIHKRRGSIAKAIALFNPLTEKGRVRVYGCRSPGKPGTQLLTVLSMLGVRKLMQSSKYKHSKRVRQWTMDWAKALLKAIPIKESKAAAPADTTPAIKHLAALVFKDKITPAEVEVLSQSAFDRLKLSFGGKPILPETVVEEGAEGDMEEEFEDDDEIVDEEAQQEDDEGAAMVDDGAAAAAPQAAAAAGSELDVNDMFADGNDDNLAMDNDDLPWMQLHQQENEPVAATEAAAAPSPKRAPSSRSPQRASASPPADAARAPKVKPAKAKSKTTRLVSTEAASSNSSAAAAADAPEDTEAELAQAMQNTSNERRKEKRREKAKQKREEARAAAAAAAATAAADKSPSPPAPKKKRTHSPAMAAAAASLSRAARSPSPPAAKVSTRGQAAPPIPKRVKRESLGTTQVSPARPMLDVRSLSHLCTPESTPRLTPLTVSASSTSTHVIPSFVAHGQHTPMFGAGSTPQSRDITPLSSRQNSPMPLFSGMQPPVKRHLRMSSNPKDMVDLSALDTTTGAASGTGSGFSPKRLVVGNAMMPANAQQMPQQSMAMTTTPMTYHPSMMYSQFSNSSFMPSFAQPQQQQQMMFHSGLNFPPHILSPVGGAGGQQQPTSMFSPTHGHSKSVTLPTPSHSLMMHPHSQSHGGAFTFGSSLSPRGTSFNPNTFMQQQSSGTQPLSHLRGGMISSTAPMFAAGFPSAQAQQAHHALNQQLATHLKDASTAHATMPMVTQATAVAMDHAPVMAMATTTPPEAMPVAAASSSTHAAADSAAPMQTDKPQ